MAGTKWQNHSVKQLDNMHQKLPPFDAAIPLPGLILRKSELHTKIKVQGYQY